MPKESTETNAMASLEPSAITRSTVSRILQHYPATAQNVFRAKKIAKAKKITKGEAKRRAARAAADEAAGIPHPPEPMRPEDDPMVEQPSFEASVRKFAALENWRYETLPELLRKRRETTPDPQDITGKQVRASTRFAKDMAKQKRNQHKKNRTYEFASVDMEAAAAEAMKEGEAEFKLSNMFYTKDELMKMYEWQAERDDVRPTQMGMMKTNPPPHVRAVTRIAISELPEPSAAADEFPDKALERICEATRGIQPLMATLPLSIATDGQDTSGTGFEMPFVSQELYLWLVLKVYPYGGNRVPKLPNKKPSWDVKPVQQTFHQFAKLRTRLNSAAPDSPETASPFSASDIEKVAYVIQHLDVSPYKYEHIPEEGTVKVASLNGQSELEYANSLLLKAGARRPTRAEKKSIKDSRRKKGDVVDAADEEESARALKKRKRDE